jgi:hypothetical protein
MLITLVKGLIKTLSEDSWLRVIFGLQGIIGHERYHKVAKWLTKANCLTVLDVGSGGTSQLSMALQVLSVDVKRNAGVDVIADASHLPFRDYTFDCVTAIDMLEHIRPQRRKKAIDEMKRCGKTVLIHTPLQDNKTFMGKTGDIILFNHLKNSLNIVDENTREHIECGEPHLDELKEHDFKVVQPDWNLNIWLTLMKYRYIPYNFTAPVMTVIYLLALRKVNTPPFYGAYLMHSNDAKAAKL